MCCRTMTAPGNVPGRPDSTRPVVSRPPDEDTMAMTGSRPGGRAPRFATGRASSLAQTMGRLLSAGDASAGPVSVGPVSIGAVSAGDAVRGALRLPRVVEDFSCFILLQAKEEHRRPWSRSLSWNGQR